MYCSCSKQTEDLIIKQRSITAASVIESVLLREVFQAEDFPTLPSWFWLTGHEKGVLLAL